MALVMVGLVCLISRIAWTDFTTLKISNASVLLLIGLYVPFGALGKFESFGADVAASALLFTISFALWLMRAIGAGDVKLYAALGLFVGMPYLGVYAVLLLAVTVLFLLLLFLLGNGFGSGLFSTRFRQIKESGRAPYGLLMCIAAVPSILLRVSMSP
ncbi:hypothetical protein GV827_20280 [Sulfitobacter sp. JBTF-M27]|uniref:Prepilin type IV endopeptidase peptidase domain-containing protein n=1 Tax=Sulfitobacter sediminilitoris TaxID=2698830 RepID=A0A6P0CI02_9RHOB|nr:prepilin peptidase [Sulfitobacter sediminilitoris]NEK24716.1 hypothetical protein [Sulfitobacter sediminilitoris]